MEIVGVKLSVDYMITNEPGYRRGRSRTILS